MDKYSNYNKETKYKHKPIFKISIVLHISINCLKINYIKNDWKNIQLIPFYSIFIILLLFDNNYLTSNNINK